MKRKAPTYRLTGLLFLVAILFINSYGQQRISTEEYIKTYKDIAIEKMKNYRIPASITLAQGILESGSGNSRLAQKANNHFGIKCHKGWTGKTFYMDDDEKNECFRKYKKAEDSYRDHSLFLTQRGRYSFLFDLKITDYKAWAKGLKKAGYATNPKYPEILISLIERYDLMKYDTQGKKENQEDKKPVKKTGKQVVTSNLSVENFNKFEKYPSGRQIFINNDRKLIIAKSGDTFFGLAKEFGIYTWQLYKYNDLEKDYLLKVGDIIYLQKKKRKAAREHRYHEVANGQTIRQISQLYGVRESRLYKINNLPKGVQVGAGEIIKLR
ncbi:MAG: glucosaminidase domain-containing protein [Bacteroidales bacterium]|nr:glucosaminidase domain-containing protein [Bacteroidales bacterium]